jgi:hypothetical protein
MSKTFIDTIKIWGSMNKWSPMLNTIECIWDSNQFFNISTYKIVKGGELQELESKGDQIKPRSLPHTYRYI